MILLHSTRSLPLLLTFLTGTVFWGVCKTHYKPQNAAAMPCKYQLPCTSEDMSTPQVSGGCRYARSCAMPPPHPWDSSYAQGQQRKKWGVTALQGNTPNKDQDPQNTQVERRCPNTCITWCLLRAGSQPGTSQAGRKAKKLRAEAIS